MIQLIVLDVDGTLSNGELIYTNEGVEIKAFNVKDGLGIAAWLKLGRKAAIITGRESQLVKTRAQELKITYLKQGVSNKAEALEEILKEANLSLKEVAIIGDDLNDLSMLRLVKYSFAPSDAVKEVRHSVYKVLKNKGGKGAVREMIDWLIKKEKLQVRFYEIFA